MKKLDSITILLALLLIAFTIFISVVIWSKDKLIIEPIIIDETFDMGQLEDTNKTTVTVTIK